MTEQQEQDRETTGQACEHFPVMHHGELTCRECRAVWRIDWKGSRWVPAEEQP